jgi:hypothetical protein
MSSAVAKAPTPAEVERLSSLGERFRMWQKRQGKSYFKMPSYLWDDAFDLVPIFGGRRVARELGVGRDELLRRMNEAQQPVVASAPASAPVSDTPQAPEQALPNTEFLDFEMDWPGSEMPQATPVDMPAVSTAPEPDIAHVSMIDADIEGEIEFLQGADPVDEIGPQAKVEVGFELNDATDSP